jgi:RsiW-degrading membrane proteinase PrsW (M82 family)
MSTIPTRFKRNTATNYLSAFVAMAAALGFLLRGAFDDRVGVAAVLEALAVATVMFVTYLAMMVAVGVDRQERRALAQTVRIPWRGARPT